MSNAYGGYWQQMLPTRKEVIMWGAGDQARVNAPILASLGVSVLAYLDETPGIESPHPGIPVFSSIQELIANLSLDLIRQAGSVIAIGNPFGRERSKYSAELEKFGVMPISFSDQSSLIRSDVKAGKGLQVMPAATIGNNVKIGDNCIINTNALVEHDCQLGDGVEIGPSAVLAGRVIVGDNSWIGAGAVVLPRVRIGSNSIIGAGSVVTRDIQDGVVVVGNPAKFLREI
jgi:sugar O-acyltransferase (sialic acid O-acetyltransferase NeuD family)